MWVWEEAAPNRGGENAVPDPPGGKSWAGWRCALGVDCLPPAPSASPGGFYFGLTLQVPLPIMKRSLHLTFVCLSLFSAR